MFFNPAKTGLIVLGASEFRHEAELNRQVFQNARDEVVRYFRSPNKGLGLHRKNILDKFNEDMPKKDLMLEIDQFLSQRRLADVFIYICTHGRVPETTLRFFTASSTLHDQDTWVNFETFIDEVEQAADCRIYCIADCCASGAIHNHSPEFAISPEAAAYVSNAEAVALPKRGTTILTANNADNVGTVYAHDSLPGVDLPLFSHCLMDLLNNGNPKRRGFGLSFEQLYEDITDRLPGEIDRINETLREENLDTISDEHGTMVPQYSDRPVFDDESGNIISRIGALPNNDAKHDLTKRVARSIRFNYDRVERQWDKIQELEALVHPLQSEVKDLREKLQSALTDDEAEPRKTLLHKLLEKKGEVEIAQLGRRNARRLAAFLGVLLIATLAALIFEFDPFLDLRNGYSE